ncbi:helix-turn-helix domain-containing protein [Streptomyces sp. NPDC058231]|uniref:helix-turn-helix domain-containing protein n=1 Tax=Streptomyces sp. NPDC058231 TaxID=3346392 RepID=UPI0036E77556
MIAESLSDDRCGQVVSGGASAPSASGRDHPGFSASAAVEQNIDRNTLEGRDFFGMMSAFATLHREFVLAATNDGLAAARARGNPGGRKSKLTQHQVDELLQLHSTGASVQQLARTFKVSRGTIYRHISLAGEATSPPRRNETGHL